jgi:hypothetical protein
MKIWIKPIILTVGMFFIAACSQIPGCDNADKYVNYESDLMMADHKTQAVYSRVDRKVIKTTDPAFSGLTCYFAGKNYDVYKDTQSEQPSYDEMMDLSNKVTEKEYNDHRVKVNAGKRKQRLRTGTGYWAGRGVPQVREKFLKGVPWPDNESNKALSEELVAEEFKLHKELEEKYGIE